jgi:hypothetical protein
MSISVYQVIDTIVAVPPARFLLILVQHAIVSGVKGSTDQEAGRIRKLVIDLVFEPYDCHRKTTKGAFSFSFVCGGHAITSHYEIALIA